MREISNFILCTRPDGSFANVRYMLFGWYSIYFWIRKSESMGWEWDEGLMWFHRTQRKWIKYPRSTLIKIIIMDGMILRKRKFASQNISSRNERARVECCNQMFQVQTHINEKNRKILLAPEIHKILWPIRHDKAVLLSFQLVSFHFINRFWVLFIHHYKHEHYRHHHHNHNQYNSIPFQHTTNCTFPPFK